MPTPQEIEDVLRSNGVDVEAVADVLNTEISAGRMDNAQAQAELNNLFNYYNSKQPTKEVQQGARQTEGYSGPGVVQGTARSFATGATAGFAPYIAGVTNYAINKVLGNEGSYEELYEEGKQDYLKSQQAFAGEHPIANVIGEGIGTVGGIALTGGTVGAGTKAALTATRLGRAGKAGQLAIRTAGEMASFGAYEAGRGATEKGKLSASGAGKGFLSGAAMGGAFGVLGGGLQYAEPSLIKVAQRMLANPMAANVLVKGLGIGVEGATIGAVPAALEGRLPTKGELLTGEAFAVGGRGLAKAGSFAGEKLYKFANTPTKRQIADSRPLLNALQGAEKQADRAAISEIEAKRELRALERQVEQGADREALEPLLKKAQAKVERTEKFSLQKQQELKDLQEITPIQEKVGALREQATELETRIKTAETEAGQIEATAQRVSSAAKDVPGESATEIQSEINKFGKEERIEDPSITSKLQPHLDNAQETVGSFMDELGWERGRLIPTKERATRYLTFTKDGQTKKIRVSGHKATGKDFDAQWDLNKSAEENLRNIGDSLKEDVSAERAELANLRKELSYKEGILPREMRTMEADVKVSATEEEIAERMKEYADNPYMTGAQAAKIIEGEKISAARRTKLDPNAGLPIRERLTRGAKELTSKFIQQFNWARPVEEAALKVEASTGREVAAIDNPVETINTARNGGEVEALLRPVVNKVAEVEKKFKGSVAGARRLLLAEKEVQFARNEGRAPSQRALEEVEAFKDNKPVQEIAAEVRKLNQKVLDKLLESGRIDKATYEKFKANDKYVPSWAEKIGDFGEQTVANNADSFLRKYGGSAVSYENPILTSLSQAKYLDQFASMQKAKKQYLKLAQYSGDVRLNNTVEKYAGGPIKFDKANQIVVWEGGKPQIWDVPKRVADYFNPVPLPPEGKITKFIKAAAAMPLRFYKGGTTAASLGFAESNIPRDVAGGMFGSQWGGNISASMLGSSARELINGEPITEPFARYFGNKTLRDVEQLPGLAEDNVKRFADMYNAINNGTKEGTPSNIMARLFTTALPTAAKKAARFSSASARKGLEVLSYTGNLSEETTRLSVFKSVLQAKAENEVQYQLWLKNPALIPEKVLAEAGREAREVTLNFRRQMAPWVETANRYFAPYFKPAILGAMRGFTMLSNPDIAPRAWRYIINLGILQGLIKGNIVDKQQMEDLDAINNEIAGKNFIFSGKDRKFYTVPLAQELAPLVQMFAGVTEKMYRNATKQEREDIGREMLQAGKDLLENYTPVAGYLIKPSNYAIGGPIPKTILEESVNKDFFTKTPIESSAQQLRPASMRQTKNTPALAIQLSKTLAKHGYEISPLRLRHIVVGLTSNVGKELFAATDSILSSFGIGPVRAKKEVTDSPYTRRLIADITAPYNQYAQDANEIIGLAKQGHKAMDSAGQESWSKQQRMRYEEQSDIYDLIEDDLKDLQELYSERAATEALIAEAAEDLQKQYKENKITKDVFQNKWRELEYDLKEFTEQQALEERMYQLNIINAAKEVRKTYKKNPR